LQPNVLHGFVSNSFVLINCVVIEFILLEDWIKFSCCGLSCSSSILIILVTGICSVVVLLLILFLKLILLLPFKLLLLVLLLMLLLLLLLLLPLRFEDVTVLPGL